MDRNGPKTDRNRSNLAFFKLSGVGRRGLLGWGGGGVVREKENHFAILGKQRAIWYSYTPRHDRGV